MNVEEAADYLRISRATLYNLMKKGELKPVKIGKRTLFDTDDLKKFFEGHKITSEVPTPAKKRGRPKKTASKK